MMIDRDAFLVPTLIAPMGVLDAPEGVAESSLRKAQEVTEIHHETIGRAAAAGVRIAMGTDCGVVPHGRNLTELSRMVSVGMAPMAAIEASTRVAAECLGVGDSRGTLEPGKVADLVAVSADPVADIDVLADPANIERVWLAGAAVK